MQLPRLLLLTAITDWAVIDANGVVQTSGTPNRTNRFFYAGGTLAGWADPLNSSASTACPSASHTVCLTYVNSQLTTVAKLLTVTTFSSGTLGTTTTTATTSIGYRGTEIASVQGPTQTAGQATTFARPAAGQVKVVHIATPNATTTYSLQASTDSYGRVATVARTLGTGTVTTRMTWDSSYPIEPASVIDNDGGSPSRTVSYSYQGSSLGLVSKIVEPLDGTYSRWTEYTYNANNDVTQRVVSRQGDAVQRTTTRYCYATSGCATNAMDLLLRSQIENYTDGIAGNGAANEQDVTTYFQYDAYGQRIRETRQNDTADGTLLDARANGWTYDDNGSQLTSIANYDDGAVAGSGDDVDPNATTGARTDLTTAVGYDTAGNQVSTADPRRAIEAAKGTSLGSDDFVSRSTFDALGHQLGDTTPTTPGLSVAQRTSAMTYDDFGNTRTAIDYGGVLTATEYDAAGRPTRTFEQPVSGSAAVTSITTYDAAGRALTAKDREQSKTGSTLGSTTTEYDELGRITKTTEAAGTPDASITLTTFDGLDRVTCSRVGWSSGSCTSVTGAGQATITTYDAGSRTTKTDDQFSCTTRTYDYRDLVLTERSGLTGTTCASGADTRTVTNTFDGLGRQTRSEVTAGTGTGDRPFGATLDAAGRTLRSESYVTAPTETTTTITSTLDPLDQVLETSELAIVEGDEIIDHGTTRTTYDPAGNPTDHCLWKAGLTVGACLPVGTIPWLNPPSQSTTASYDARNQRIELQDGATNSTTTYDPDHNYQIAAVYLPTGTGREHQTLYGYDGRHRLVSITQQLCVVSSGHACSSTTATGSDSYAYDDNDNRTQVAESNGAGSTDERYCYDALNRLTFRNTASACASTAKDEAYTYDASGNRTSATVGASTNTFTYATGQLTGCTTGCSTVTHDTAGNVSRLGAWAYEYDQDGRLVRACKAASCATGSPDKVEFTYDGDGHRTQVKEYTAGVLTTTRDFRYQGDAIVEESTNGTVTRGYLVDEAGTITKVCDPNCDSPTTTYLPVWNGHGDATALYRINSDGSLTLANSYTYSSWGAPTTTVAGGFTDLGFRFLYVGRSDVQWDNFSGLGLTYMHARHYSPAIGRFLQPDPAAAEPNLYAYASDNPTTRADPSGRFSQDCWRLAWEAAQHLIVLQIRYWAIRQNPRDLPISGKNSVEGHRQQFRQVQRELRKVTDDIAERCKGQGPKPPFLRACGEWAWKWAPYPDKNGTWNGHPPKTSSSSSSSGWGFRIDPDAARYLGFLGGSSVVGAGLGWILVRAGGGAGKLLRV